jgi:hypothetical protein
MVPGLIEFHQGLHAKIIDRFWHFAASQNCIEYQKTNIHIDYLPKAKFYFKYSLFRYVIRFILLIIF